MIPLDETADLPEPIRRLITEGYLDAEMPELPITSPYLGVMFDTNAYRSYLHGLDRDAAARRIERLRRVEHLFGVIAFANPWVIMELVAHLVDPEDPAFEVCRTSLRAVWQHCWTLKDGRPQLAMAADSESQMCYSLFGETPEGHARQNEILGTLARFAFEHPDNIVGTSASDVFRTTAADVARIEAQFVAHLRRHVLQRFKPGAMNWTDIRNDSAARDAALRMIKSAEWRLWVAKVHVYKAVLQLYGEPRHIEEEASRVAWVAENFRTPIEMYTEIVRRIVMSGLDVETRSRANWVWDMQIAFSVGNGNTLDGGKPILLVTSDRALIESAQAAGAAELVNSLDDYLARFPSGLLL